MRATPSGLPVRDRAECCVHRPDKGVEGRRSSCAKVRLCHIGECMNPHGANPRSRALERMGEVRPLGPGQSGIGQSGQDRSALVGEQDEHLAGEIGVAAGLRIKRCTIDRRVERRPAGAFGFRVLWGLRI